MEIVKIKLSENLTNIKIDAERFSLNGCTKMSAYSKKNQLLKLSIIEHV